MPGRARPSAAPAASGSPPSRGNRAPDLISTPAREPRQHRGHRSEAGSLAAGPAREYGDETQRGTAAGDAQAWSSPGRCTARRRTPRRSPAPATPTPGSPRPPAGAPSDSRRRSAQCQALDQQLQITRHPPGLPVRPQASGPGSQCEGIYASASPRVSPLLPGVDDADQERPSSAAPPQRLERPRIWTGHCV